jgi:uncharacterized protein with PQ loop repeat
MDANANAHANAKYISGYCAIVFTIGVKLPQIRHTWKTKKAADLSMGYLICQVFAHASWFMYGIFDDFNQPILITDSISICLTLILIGLKIKYAE